MIVIWSYTFIVGMLALCTGQRMYEMLNRSPEGAKSATHVLQIEKGIPFFQVKKQSCDIRFLVLLYG